MAEIGTMVVRPSTPVAATPLASVPSYDLPISADFPLCQDGTMVWVPAWFLPTARLLSQSTTDFTPAMSPGPPCMGHPVEFDVPFISARITA
jgi:hypothetical protein